MTTPETTTPETTTPATPATTTPTTRATRRQAATAVAASFARTAALLARRRLRSPRGPVGTTRRGEDGTTSVVFRETAVDDPVDDPVVLVVCFRLRGIGRARWAHAVFRRTCVVNTPLFAGFPGFRDKLWMYDASTGVYRGVYLWDGAERARWYAERLRRVLELVAVRGTIDYTVVRGTRRDPFPTAGRPSPSRGAG
ncbi:hypothetical protein [Pseudonocardia xishanensis]|uniref:DUF4188 domain-containing protein n=1 Tax=Pseudonocardia xishanensis TaxID=630995 RepID=A0ABP8RLW5_9PSEU